MRLDCIEIFLAIKMNISDVMRNYNIFFLFLLKA